MSILTLRDMFMLHCSIYICFFFFKQKTAYEMRISDWSSDVCSSDLPESNRLYRGNPSLTDSELWNAELRYEWYFERDQRFTVAGFYKSIDKPIEAYTSASDNQVSTSYANAPKATLYGAEFEVQEYVPQIGRAHVCTPVTNAPLV